MIGPCQFVIFGATGDLSLNKLLPALYHLHREGRLPGNMAIVAVSRRDWDVARWQAFMREQLPPRLGAEFREDDFSDFAGRFGFVQVVHDDPSHYANLKAELSKPREGVCANIVFYLSIATADFAEVVSQLDAAGLSGRLFGNRIVVEKPFGHDLESARELNRHLHRHFEEEQIYRIDHYLGKETVQNLLVFRFANTIVEPIWNRHYVDHVQITVAEGRGIGSRAGYFDRTGTARDMLQNHIMQLLSVVAMEPPAQMDANVLRDEKVKVLRSLRSDAGGATRPAVLRAQYSAGDDAIGYREEAGVADDSQTETYVAARFHVDNWRWSGVPFYVRTGKCLARDGTVVSLRLKRPPLQLFGDTQAAAMAPNWIVLSIQPTESMHIEMQAKEPGLDMNTRSLSLRASFRAEHERPLGAYETLLLDVIEGDRSLFIRFDEVEWSWKVVDPILQQFADDHEPILTYRAGSWGPARADHLFERADRQWRNPE